MSSCALSCSVLLSYSGFVAYVAMLNNSRESQLHLSRYTLMMISEPAQTRQACVASATLIFMNIISELQSCSYHSLAHPHFCHNHSSLGFWAIRIDLVDHHEHALMSYKNEATMLRICSSSSFTHRFEISQHPYSLLSSISFISLDKSLHSLQCLSNDPPQL